MQKRIIASVFTIILLISLPFAFLSSIQTEEKQKDDDSGDCDSSYPDICIPSPPPELNCKDIPNKKFKVLPPDPHGFDRDGDGTGCET